jgi:4-hydroxy 2-oxovalerate aldolase
MVSGANSLPQKEVMEWVTQRYYSFNSIIRAMRNRMNGENDNIKLREFIPGRSYSTVIIIGGGDSARIHADAVIRFAKTQNDVCLVHASSKNARYYENIDMDQFFCLVGHEGKRLEEVFNTLESFNGKCILPPYPRKMGTYIPERVRSQSFELSKIDFTELYQDSHTALALQTAKELNAGKVFLAGYDGYSQDNISTKEQALISENEFLFSKFMQLKEVSSLFITRYSVPIKSVYTLIE